MTQQSKQRPRNENKNNNNKNRVENEMKTSVLFPGEHTWVHICMLCLADWQEFIIAKGDMHCGMVGRLVGRLLILR